MKFQIEAKRYAFSGETDVQTVDGLDNALAAFAKKCETHAEVSMKKIDNKRNIREDALRELFS